MVLSWKSFFSSCQSWFRNQCQMLSVKCWISSESRVPYHYSLFTIILPIILFIVWTVMYVIYVMYVKWSKLWFYPENPSFHPVNPGSTNSAKCWITILATHEFIHGGETRIKPQPTNSFVGRGKNSFMGARQG